ncbi:hypothetical protein STCU_10092 [Strigomonas culicis]|uniref:RING-type domain-containing protein n=1 Tax=Strigomonas culicis TaxID=28005 RepID=S9TNG4_9TRYP|nr:hypothetical protein STCU_10092 [Strigomonas culicis]|eukprot:EPY18269.1 hypothetical protein STCU_10092 [Strigomonas culicis]
MQGEGGKEGNAGPNRKKWDASQQKSRNLVGDILPSDLEEGEEAQEPEEEEEEVQGFLLDEGRLREKFRKEAEEDLQALFEECIQLREEVAEQDRLLKSFHKDVYHLSRGKDGLNSEHFALELTKEVNLFAQENHLKLNKILLNASSDSIESIADGFLRRFGKERPEMHDAGTQVTDEDLGYVDEGVKQVETRLNELYFHEKGLVQSIKLATVAVANIMSFHSSLEIESTCKECFYIFENPRTLWPCGHTFCLQCLSGMYNRNGELICTECGSACEVGYTPNLTVELISNYQLLQESAEGNGQASGGKGRTIESVLRNIIKDLLSTQRSYGAAVGPELTAQRVSFE